MIRKILYFLYLYIKWVYYMIFHMLYKTKDKHIKDEKKYKDL